MHHNFDEIIEPESKNNKNRYIKFLRQNGLTLATICGVILGAILGFILRATKEKWTENEIMYLGFIGDLFLKMLKSLIIPLIISCLVSAIASLDLSLSRKVAIRAISYYLTTTFASVILGIIVVVSIQPGVGKSQENDNGLSTVKQTNSTTVNTLLDLVRNMFPANIIEACIFQRRTILIPAKDNTSDTTIGSEIVQTTNILGLVVVSAIVGIALGQLGEETKTLANFFHNLLTLTMKITSWVIKLSPVGVMFLIAAEIVQIKDLAAVMSSLGLYFLTVLIGLSIQGFIILPLLYFVLTRRNPFVYIKCLGEAIATGFGTASSTATLPITIRCLEEKLHIDSRIARFTLPIGSTINMDGTALYEAVAAIYIAQVCGVSLDIGKIFAISITATAASIGAAGIPQAGLVTMVMVLETVGLPAENVSLILSVDWLLDRFRTAINIMGDAFGSGVVHYRSLKELNNLDMENTQTTKRNSNIDNGKSSSIRKVSEE